MDKFANLRVKLGEIFEGQLAHYFIVGLIILSSFTIAIEINQDNAGVSSGFISTINNLIILFFAVEITARIIAHGAAFFKDPWHVFDFIIVFISLLAFGGFFQVFRTFRLFWYLRALSSFPEFEHLISAIGHAIPHLISAAVMLLLSVAIFALVGSIEFGVDYPHLFGTVGTSMMTIFHSVLLEHTWSETLGVLKNTHPNAGYFINPMIITLNFFLLNLVVGVIISALNRQYKREERQKGHTLLEKILGDGRHEFHKEEESPMSADTKILIHEIRKLREEINELKK